MISNKNRRPSLLLIGVGGVIAAGMLSGCDEAAQKKVDVLRTRYDSQEACMLVWSTVDDCVYIADPAGQPATPASGASSTSTGSGHGGGGGGHWYGPYYTRGGTVYHTGKAPTEGVVPPLVTSNTEELTVRESSLTPGSTVYRETPDVVSASEHAAISRGGFMSSEGGEGGHGGGGEGGGHGSGGG
jgi:hypothetical protein